MASIKGRVTGEVHFLFEKMKAFGTSKRALKVKALEEGKRFDFYYREKIFSFSTYKTYKVKAKSFAHWCVDKFNIQSAHQISPSMFKEYVREKLLQMKPNSVKTYLAAVAKFGESIGQAEAFHRIAKKTQRVLPAAAPSRPTYHGLSQALRVQAELEKLNPRYGLAMRLQLESACRLVEVSRLRVEDLKGVSEIDGKRCGILHLSGKGDRPREVAVSEQTYRELEKTFSQKCKLVGYEGYRAAVKRVSEKLGLHSGGTHKARRFSVQKYVRDGFKALRALGLSSQEASENLLHEANWLLGHSPERVSTTKVYLNR